MKKHNGSVGSFAFVEPAFVDEEALSKSEAFKERGDIVVPGSACLLEAVERL